MPSSSPPPRRQKSPIASSKTPKSKKKKQRRSSGGGSLDGADEAVTPNEVKSAAVKSAAATPKKATTKAASSTSAEKLPPQVDVLVHRFCHLPYHPRAVIRLASAPQPRGAKEGAPAVTVPHLAVSREGGSVDFLARGKEKWRAVGRVAGLRGREVDCLAWTCGLSSSSEAAVVNGNAKMDVDESGGGEDAMTCSSPAHRHSERVQSLHRLFGASCKGTVFELDFATGR